MFVDDETRLRHMLDAAREASAFARGHTRADLESNRLLALGLVKLIEIIGEAASKITREFQDAHTEVPWRKIVGMRHVLVHDYDRIDLEIVWEVVATDLPAFVTILEPLVTPDSGAE